MNSDMDGFRALKLFSQRFESNTAASLLQSAFAALVPGRIKNVNEVVGKLNAWEVAVSTLYKRHNIKIDEKLKAAVLVCMVPKEIQEMVFGSSVLKNEADLKYEPIRDFVLNVVKQKITMAMPRPMETDRIEDDSSNPPEDSKPKDDEQNVRWGRMF